METDITLTFLKYLIKYEKIDIEHLRLVDKDKFVGSNLHKLIASLCINYVNLKSTIDDEKLRMDLDVYRNLLIHCEGSTNSKNIRAVILEILEHIERLINVEDYSEYLFMIYKEG